MTGAVITEYCNMSLHGLTEHKKMERFSRQPGESFSIAQAAFRGAQIHIQNFRNVYTIILNTLN